MNNDHPLSKIREKLAKVKGPLFWRSLDEAAETEEFQRFLKEEYPYGAGEFEAPVDRREFLKLMGASLVMAGLAGCKPYDKEKIVPYVKAPEEMLPGKPLFFATAMAFNGSTTGLLAESQLGRPTKIEGNPQHPDSLGATDVFAQASVLGLYDPDRSKTVRNGNRLLTWDAFSRDILRDMETQKTSQGSGLRILTETVISPTLTAQIKTLLQAYPKARWHQYDPVNADMARRGSKLAFGEYFDSLYDFKKADIIVSLDANFLSEMPGSLRYARDFSLRRQVVAGTGLDKNQPAASSMNRLYAIESTPSLTGAAADHRFIKKPSEIADFAAALAVKLGVQYPSESRNASLTDSDQKWLMAISEDLKAHAGKSIVIAGAHQPPAVHALAHAMNQLLGNIGTTVSIIPTVEEVALDQTESLRELTRDLDQGKVELLLVIGGNPVYNAPADLDFAEKFQRAGRRVHLSLYDDETSALAHWHIPQTHFLESFSDGRASDGTVTFMQPLIEPLYSGKSAHEFIAALMDEPAAKDYDLVRAYWNKQWSGDFEKKWRRSIHEGFLENSAFAPKNPKAKTTFTADEIKKSLPKFSAEGFELLIQPDSTVWDGRFANYSWLQELPKVMTTLTWDNAALLSPASAEKLAVQNGDIVRLELDGRFVDAPVWILPGQPDETVTIHLGYGRTRSGKVANGIGFDAYKLRSSLSPSITKGLVLHKTGRKQKMAATQVHHSMEGRDLIRKATFGEYQKHPDFAHAHHHDTGNTSLYPGFNKGEYAWGMSVNLNSCIGCNACVIACQSENNIPVVGKNEVLKGREMHWIRIDRYYEGGLENPEVHHQPVMCMHCENAPCEPVCPFGATGHSPDGLNEMTYNRCAGTKYCANNCPYKVRRFNFLEYTDRNSETLKMQRNPDVTVRARGVMEKCTFCVQRINRANIDAKVAGRKVVDGDIKTACQSACPTNALVFGDLKDSASQVSKLKATPLDYGLLTELNTVPRLTYMAKVTNPNPQLTEKAAHGLHA